MNIVQLAGMLPRDPLFRDFVGHNMIPPRAATVDEAADFIRDQCIVESRRELARDLNAAERFHDAVRRPFVDWKERQTDTTRG